MRTTVKPNKWYGWTADVTVEVERVTTLKALALANTVYAVYVDGTLVGYVGSQKSGRNTTYWGHLKTLDSTDRFSFGAPSRALSVTALVDDYVR